MSDLFTRYQQAKAASPNTMLFVQMGDYLELIGDDAIVAARELGVTLTTYGKRAGNPTPMVGIPVYSFEPCRATLTSNGHQVAIFDEAA